jgi:hypothetical protein
VFDFEITGEDMQELDGLDERKSWFVPLLHCKLTRFISELVTDWEVTNEP